MGSACSLNTARNSGYLVDTSINSLSIHNNQTKDDYNENNIDSESSNTLSSNTLKLIKTYEDIQRKSESERYCK